MGDKPNARELAKQGNQKAIAALINHNLKSQNIRVKRLMIKDECLYIALEGEKIEPKGKIISFLNKFLTRLSIDSVQKARVFGHKLESNDVVWREEISFHAMPEVTKTEKPIDLSKSSAVTYQLTKPKQSSNLSQNQSQSKRNNNHQDFVLKDYFDTHTIVICAIYSPLLIGALFSITNSIFIFLFYFASSAGTAFFAYKKNRNIIRWICYNIFPGLFLLGIPLVLLLPVGEGKNQPIALFRTIFRIIAENTKGRVEDFPHHQEVKKTQGHNPNQLICSNCGSVGTPKKLTKGNIGIEVVLWLFFLVPGIIYSVWRLTTRTDVCRSCGSENIIPLNSPKGRKLQNELGITDSQSNTLKASEASGLETEARSIQEHNKRTDRDKRTLFVGVPLLLILCFGLITIGSGNLTSLFIQTPPGDWERLGFGRKGQEAVFYNTFSEDPERDGIFLVETWTKGEDLKRQTEVSCVCVGSEYIRTVATSDLESNNWTQIDNPKWESSSAALDWCQYDLEPNARDFSDGAAGLRKLMLDTRCTALKVARLNALQTETLTDDNDLPPAP